MISADLSHPPRDTQEWPNRPPVDHRVHRPMPGKSRRRQLEEERAQAAAAAEGNAATGRYHRGRDAQAHRLALLGLTDEAIAAAMDIEPASFYEWKANRKTFRQAIARGRDDADAKVAGALHRSATGYSHRETKVFKVGEELQTVEMVKHYPPSVPAIELWLTNRQRDRWRASKVAERPVSIDLVSILQAIGGAPTLPPVDDRAEARPTLAATFIDATDKEPDTSKG